jgi:hypothetical protein
VAVSIAVSTVVVRFVAARPPDADPPPPTAAPAT